MTIRLVAFDYGGVLTAPPFTALLDYEQELGLPEGELCAEFRGGALMRDAELGRRAVVDVLGDWRTAISTTHAVDVDLQRVYDSFRAAAVVDPYMIDLLHRIDLPLALVTNNLAETRRRWTRDLPVDRFAVVIDSSEVGVRKPDPEIWALLVERSGLSPAEILMVDDFEVNCEGAREAGMTAVRFLSNEQAIPEVEDALRVARSSPSSR